MSGQSAGKTKYQERNNHPQGRSGGKVRTIPGPAVGKSGGRKSGNPTKGGGIYRPTKGKGGG